MIIKKEKKGNIMVIHVSKDIPDDKMFQKFSNKFLKPSQIKTILDEDCDVYTEDDKLLLKFRKKVLPQNNVSQFYDNVIQFAVQKTQNRGSTSGSEKKNVNENPKIMSNIIGYYDKFAPSQKLILTRQNKRLLEARQTRFIMDYPERYQKLIPLIKNIDHLYKKYIPDNYAKQKKKANQTHFKIPNTAFTTITTNVNFQTTVHTDKGDDSEGFGNLAVIEHGEYTGGETCFPQYGIGVNVRTNDILFMDVHQWHGNLPISYKTKDAKRLSIVCYLRKNVWEKTRGKSKQFMIQHNHTIKNLRLQKVIKKTNKTKKKR